MSERLRHTFSPEEHRLKDMVNFFNPLELLELLRESGRLGHLPLVSSRHRGSSWRFSAEWEFYHDGEMVKAGKAVTISISPKGVVIYGGKALEETRENGEKAEDLNIPLNELKTIFCAGVAKACNHPSLNEENEKNNHS